LLKALVEKALAVTGRVAHHFFSVGKGVGVEEGDGEALLACVS